MTSGAASAPNPVQPSSPFRPTSEEGECSVDMPRVLIIEDEGGIRTMLRDLLEEAGYEVSEAPNGLQGINLFERKPADLIIVDMIMPERKAWRPFWNLKLHILQ